MPRIQFVLGGALVVMCAVVAAAGAAQPVFSERNLDAAMKVVGRNMGLLQIALGARDFDAAKVRVVRVRENLFPTLVYWRNHDEPDGTAFLKQAIEALDELDGVLSNTPVAAAASAAAEKVDGACQRCHAVYRQEDPATKTFVVKGRR